MTASTRSIGEEAERIARRYLQNAGFTVLETNWRYRHLEIDIIASLPGIIVFVEVKFRRTDEFGQPEVWVNQKKQSLLIRAANEYILSRDLDLEARFDVISITGDTDFPNIRHLEGAFFPVAK